MKIVRQCEFCETTLVYEQDGKTYEFTEHDDEACKVTVRETIRISRETMKMRDEARERRYREIWMRGR